MEADSIGAAAQFGVGELNGVIFPPTDFAD